VIKVGTLAKIRRLYHRDKQSIKEISRQTGLARNTVRSWLREPRAVEPKYAPNDIVTELGTYVKASYRWSEGVDMKRLLSTRLLKSPIAIID
jgi:transposase